MSISELMVTAHTGAAYVKQTGSFWTIGAAESHLMGEMVGTAKVGDLQYSVSLFLQIII